MIYLPTNFSPKNETIDMTQLQILSAQINGTKCTDYKIIAKNNDTNVTLYDSTKIHLDTPLYDKSMLNHPLLANSIANGLNCKWTLEVFDGETSVTSGEIFFKTSGTGTVTLIVPKNIDSQKYDFTAIYSHPQNVDVKKFKFILYDEFEEIIPDYGDSGYFYHSNLTYAFEGFLNNNTYKIECIVIDQNDIEVSSGLQTFSVSYAQPSVNIIPAIEVLNDKGAIKFTWGKAVQIIGRTTGNVSYVNEFIRKNNKELSLDPIVNKTQLTTNRNSSVINPLESYNYIDGEVIESNALVGSEFSHNTPFVSQINDMQVTNNEIYDISNVSSITYDLDIPAINNIKFKFKFSEGFKGIFCSLGNNDYKIGYDGVRFYFDNKGSLFYSQPMELPTSEIYVDIRPTDIFIGNIRIGF